MRATFERFVALMLREPRHVEVLSRAPAGAGHVTQPSRHEHQRTAAVGEGAHDARPPADLPHDPLQRIVGADPRPVLAWEGHVAERLGHALFDDLGGLGELHLVKLRHDVGRLLLGRLAVLLGVDRLEHRHHFPGLARGHDREHVAEPVDHATLPGGLGVKLAERFDQPQALVADHEFHTR